MKNLILIIVFLQSFSCIGQINQFTISAQGSTVKSTNNIVITQSIGQLSVIGNQETTNYFISSGFQKPFSFPPKITISHLGEPLNIYPNPAQGYININPNMKGSFLISIFELSGQLVFQNTASIIEDIITIELTDINPGMYIIQLKGEHILLDSKMIKL